MRKLLLAPFLLSSLFSFGGELKSHPDSLYEIPNTKLDISDPKKLNNNNSKQYFLRANVFELGGLPNLSSYYRNISSHEDIPFSDLSACLRAKKTIKDFVLRAHKNVGDRRIKFYGFCSPGEKNTISKYEIPEYYKFQLDWVEDGPSSREPSIQFPNFPTHFLDKSSCETNGRRTTTQVRGMNINSILLGSIKLRSRYVCIKTSNL